jgi:DNA-binding NarL/FixJ family response regulator
MFRGFVAKDQAGKGRAMTLSRPQQALLPEADLSKTIGVVASTALVETLYVQLLTQAALPGAVALGLSGPIGKPERLGCLLMVLDSSTWRDAIIARTAELKSKTRARVICIYDGNLTDVIRWSQKLDVFVFLKASAPFSVIASAVVLACYVNDYSVSLPASEPDLSGTVVPVKEAGHAALTARQLDVLRLLAKGYSNKAMAHSLLVSEPTVKLHLASLRRIFNATNWTEVLVKALKIGVFPL